MEEKKETNIKEEREKYSSLPQKKRTQASKKEIEREEWRQKKRIIKI
jgi:hypothetical protein